MYLIFESISVKRFYYKTSDTFLVCGRMEWHCRNSSLNIPNLCKAYVPQLDALMLKGCWCTFAHIAYACLDSIAACVSV